MCVRVRQSNDDVVIHEYLLYLGRWVRRSELDLGCEKKKRKKYEEKIVVVVVPPAT